MAAWGEDPVREESPVEWLILRLAREAQAAQSSRSRVAPELRRVQGEEERKRVECTR
jgi:hypothetical protein